MRTLALPAFLALLALAAASLPGARHAHAEGAIAIAAGGTHTCALMENGGLKCWGYNFQGQIGDGTSGDFSRPAPVDVCQVYDASLEQCSVYLAGLAAVAAGDDHTCALTLAGSVKCWGDATFGQLGVEEVGTCTDALLGGEFPCSQVPIQVPGLESGVVSLDAGQNHTCAVMATGRVKCWGWNYSGMLGDGTTTWSSTPVDVVGLPEPIAAVALGFDHTCAVDEASEVWCWGANRSGELGNEALDLCVSWVTKTELPCNAVPRNVCGTPLGTEGQCSTSLSGVASIALGSSHSCALLKTGGVQCWGLGDERFGLLGDGGLCGATCLTPVPVCADALCEALLEQVIEIDAKSLHTCAVTRQGGVKCWGEDRRGNLGNGVPGEVQTTPTDVLESAGGAALSGVQAVAAGGSFVCALTSTAQVKCWGSNCCGQLGNGAPDFEPHPLPSDALGFDPKPTPTPLGTLGDANCDGMVSSVDAALVLQFQAGLLPSVGCLSAADVNGDGSITSVDAALILQFTAGLIGSL